VLETTYKTSESVTIVDVEHRTMQYLFHDGTGYTFMDQQSYEQVTMSDEDVVRATHAHKRAGVLFGQW
jgi:elongation factor P